MLIHSMNSAVKAVETYEVLPENVRVVLPNPYQSAVDLNRKQMIVIGNMMVLMLDVWQRLGGTFDELCLTVAFSILTKTVKHTTLIKTVLEYETQK